MNTRYLLLIFGLLAVLLALGGLAASLLSSDPENERQANCPELVPAVSRDADAQVLVDSVDAATIAAHGVNDDVQFHSIAIYLTRPGTEPILYFYFVAKNRPPVIVSFGPNGEPSAAKAQVKFPDSPGPELTLDDLTLGPNRARSIVQAQYPAAESIGMGLTRQENCELVWAIWGSIPQDGKPPLYLRAAIDNATGQISLPGGPPASPGNPPGSAR
jgi:hypothetical protein